MIAQAIRSGKGAQKRSQAMPSVYGIAGSAQFGKVTGPGTFL